MNVLQRLAHARTLERLDGRRPAKVQARQPTPSPARVERGFECRRLEFDTAGPRPELLGACLDRLEFPAAARLAQDLACLGAAEAGRPAVIDLESTGLAGSALPFVIGVAWPRGPRVELRQWVLSRVGAEAEMLADVFRILREQGAGPLMSFNGASFDLPLLRLRAQRHGLDASVLSGAHVDVLHCARRVYRSELGDCRLGTLERRVLGVHRRGDIDGAQIPQVFWDFLQDGGGDARARLDAVCAHNLVDILSLPSLASAVAGQLREPASLERARRAARHWLGLGAAGHARRVLATHVESDVAPHRRGRSRARASAWRAAALELATLERRAGRLTVAARLWEAAWRDDPGCPAASEAWAKYLEHQAGDFAAALEVARRSRLPCPRRIGRLERRAAASQAVVEPEPKLESQPMPSSGPEPDVCARQESRQRPPSATHQSRSSLLEVIDDEHGAQHRYRLLV